MRDSTRYLYKDAEVNYQRLLAAVEETEGGYGDGRSVARSKSATVEDETNIAELKKKIENLASVVKSSNMINKPQGPLAKPKFRTPRKDVGVPPDSPAKSKGTGMNATGLIINGNKPMQCYNCGGWGYGWQHCPTALENIDCRSLNRAELPPMKMEQGPNQVTKIRIQGDL